MGSARGCRGLRQTRRGGHFLFQGAPMPLIYMAMRGRLVIGPFDRETLKAAGAGIMSLLGYGAIIWALTLSPMGPISALRETSILFAVLMGRIFLGETLTVNRVVAGVTIAIGAICLSAGARPCTHVRSPAPLSPACFVCVMVHSLQTGRGDVRPTACEGDCVADDGRGNALRDPSLRL